MSQIKNPQQFAAIEYCLQHYFTEKLAPVMKQVKDELNSKQVKELADYQRSPAGILASAHTGMVASPFDALTHVQLTGEWNSKTVEDYLRMCNTQIQQNPSIQKDLAVMAEEWREAVVKQIGRSKYDALSKQLGTDIAYAYVGLRMEDLMVGKLVKDGMPKSSAEYILRKAAQSTIWGLPQQMLKSPLASEIEARGERAYRPGGKEQMAGKAVGAVVDAVSLGGVGTWKSFATFVGSDLAFAYLSGKQKTATPQEQKVKTMQAGLSKGVFGSNQDVIVGFRKQANTLNAFESSTVKSINSRLSHKLFIPNPNFSLMTWNDKTFTQPASPFLNSLPTIPTGKRDEKYKDVPLIVAPGHEEAYLRGEAQRKEAQASKAKEVPTQEVASTTEQQEATPQEQTVPTVQTNPDQTNTNGWDGLLANVGLNGFGDITRNMGYVLAMLPDVLVGIFTGKTKSLGLRDNIMPIASILLGMFVKNPILKWTLIGMGGANLLNKAGHEALDNKKADAMGTTANVQRVGNTQYKVYPDEALNPRISNPVLQGHSLIATIDRVPCTIQLTENVVNAYQAGALPLNTLANAVLAKNDQMRQMVERNYGEAENEAVHRTRGIQ